jgi:hypothetical protein
MWKRLRSRNDIELASGSSNSPIHAEARRAANQVARFDIRMKGIAAMAKSHADAVTDVTIHQLYGEAAILQAAEGIAAGRLTMMDLTARKLNNAVIVNDSDFRRWFG